MKKSYNFERERDEGNKQTPQELLTTMCSDYISSLASTDRYNIPELEVKFGTKGYKSITKLDYDNVIKKLISEGYTCNNSSGEHSLKIFPELLDIRSGEVKTSNIRVEIDGLLAIQEYCKTNDIMKIINNQNYIINLIQKGYGKGKEGKPSLRPVDFKDFNFRVSYSTESKISMRGKMAQEVYDNWSKSKKMFRYINRVTYTKPGSSFKIDISIIRSSTKKDNQIIKTYNIDESNVFNNPEIFEIEIEAINDITKINYPIPQQEIVSNFTKHLLNVSKIILCGLQKTNYPISYTEQNTILQDYMKLLYKEEYKPEKRIYPSDFIGPSSKTLQIKHIVPKSENTNIPNIRTDFCVTDKADGQRHMLYVNGVGRIYLISSNMEIIYTGAKTEEQKCFNSLIDGELILHDKNGQFINTYAAFDIYYLNFEDIRAYGFMPTEKTDDYTKFRLPILKNYINILKPIGITSKHSELKTSPIIIESKKFYPFYNTQEARAANAKPDMNIFDACNYLLSNVKDGLYKYVTDGLIFTHTKYGVGSNSVREAGPLRKITWEYSFKWKPAEYNTVDFLVTTKKGPNGDDVITSIYEDGKNLLHEKQLTQYKTLILMCGFDEKKHGFINPCADVLEDKLPEYNPELKGDTYVPKRFIPTNPYDPNAGLCNIIVKKDALDNLQMFTEENETFTDETIVEFKRDMDREGLFKWVPLRVRYDKTFELKQGLKNYGNAYNVANDVWYSIHNPISEEMICTGNNIPEVVSDEDVYYSQETKTTDTKALRDFHNLYVKKLLIQNVSKRGNTLIDFACGKGGDFPKWIGANLSFVFGIDISKDNLENRFNGACARFLNFRKEYKNMPYALFVNGDSSLNIRSGQAMLNDKAVQITKAVFGEGTKDPKLGAGVVRQFGKGETGFDVTSIQFAIHYMFENPKTFHNLMRNVAECTKLGGHFIGTSYDGKTVFNMLKRKKTGESISSYYQGRKMWQVVKDYSSEVFDDDESCLGFKISVFQESINQLIPEYLVNYDYLNRIMENYGFVLLTREEAKQIGIPNGTGMFSELFNKMKQDITRDPVKGLDYGLAPSMKDYEEQISFLNRYFIYKKIRTVNAEKIANNFLAKLPLEELDDIVGSQKTKEIVKEVVASNKANTKAKRLDKKLVLVGATEAIEEKPIAKTATATATTKVFEEVEEEEIVIPVSKPKKTTKLSKPTIELIEEEE